jgi:ankyrin repeat protein
MSLVIDALKHNASLETIRVLMDRKGYSIDYLTPGRITALTLSIEMGREDVTLELVRRGANVELADPFTSPLTLACENNLLATAHALVNAGADVNRRAAFRTPLSSAALGGLFGMTQKLLLWGAHLSPLDLHGRHARSIAESHGHVRIVTLLDTVSSMLVLRAAAEASSLGCSSALKRFPKDLCRMVGAMLM